MFKTREEYLTIVYNINDDFLPTVIILLLPVNSQSLRSEWLNYISNIYFILLLKKFEKKNKSISILDHTDKTIFLLGISLYIYVRRETFIIIFPLYEMAVHEFNIPSENRIIPIAKNQCVHTVRELGPVRRVQL